MSSTLPFTFFIYIFSIKMNYFNFKNLTSLHRQIFPRSFQTFSIFKHTISLLNFNILCIEMSINKLIIAGCIFWTRTQIHERQLRAKDMTLTTKHDNRTTWHMIGRLSAYWSLSLRSRRDHCVDAAFMSS